MASAPNYGAITVRNFMSREWPIECKQKRWTVLPRDDNINAVLGLFQFAPEFAVPQFRGLQLVFEIILHEDHPHRAPTLKVWTPNGRVIPGDSLCIDGVSAFHPESWNIATSFTSIVERFIGAFADLENVKASYEKVSELMEEKTVVKAYSIGFVKEPIDEEMRMFAGMSVKWNRENFPELVEQWEEQCCDCDAPPPAKKEYSLPDEIEYEYSDEE